MGREAFHVIALLRGKFSLRSLRNTKLNKDFESVKSPVPV
jgi:hypothetical protein